MKILYKEKEIIIPESVIFTRPVARQSSGIYTLCMIAKVPYLQIGKNSTG